MERITKQRHPSTLRLTNEAHRMLRALADMDGLSANAWIETTIRREHRARFGMAGLPAKPVKPRAA